MHVVVYPVTTATSSECRLSITILGKYLYSASISNSCETPNMCDLVVLPAYVKCLTQLADMYILLYVT